jgi:ABC-type phosphate transport system substrate-binding protein
MTYGFVRNHDNTTFVKPSLANVTYAVTNATAPPVTLPEGNQSWASVNLLNAKGLDSYPIVSFSYLLVYREISIRPGMTLDKAKALVDFLWFTIHNGQAQATPLAYVPLPAGIVAIDERSIESITFNGQTLPT